MGENKASYLTKSYVEKIPASDQKDVHELKTGVGNAAGGALQNPLGKFVRSYYSHNEIGFTDIMMTRPATLLTILPSLSLAVERVHDSSIVKHDLGRLEVGVFRTGHRITLSKLVTFLPNSISYSHRDNSRAPCTCPARLQIRTDMLT